ncbi:Bdr family repetitive protein [Borreliella bavariensis]|uniref:Bdr family repetitive protein n=1 Tax=Borreliella bavariensis TaxID=664662 RepID=UPI001C008C54|nr:Bdr family repetitive protein [Borreliella bavariensis]
MFEQLIVQDLSKRYYHNELTYRDLEKQFGIKFDNLGSKIDSVKSELTVKIDSVEKNLNTKIDNAKSELTNKIDTVEKNLKQNLDEKLKIYEKFLLEKLNISNRLIIIITIIIAPIAISSIANIITSIINGFSK